MPRIWNWRLIKRSGFGVLTILSVILFNRVSLVAAQAMSSGDINSIIGHTPFYDPNASFTCEAPTTISGAPNTAAPNETQVKYAQIIIGIAKSENLGKQGALIGLAVGLGESGGLHNLANSKIPVSLGFPNDGPPGHDFDSVGIFQQRVATGWSTLTPGTPDYGSPSASQSYANDHPDAVKQIMTPEYATTAFFGSPPGSHAPGALSKGLQNVSGWQSLPPEIAAQKVQRSAPGGAFYKAQLPLAQSLIDKYYDSSPAIPPAVPIAVGGGSSNSQSSGCNTSSTPGPISGCTNPFTDPGWGLARTDQGVDYIPNKPLPVRAICDGTIVYTGDGGYTGWPFDRGGSLVGPFIMIKLSSGPFAGKCTYVAEHLTEVSPVGTSVKAGQQIATALPDYAWTEWGWAQGPKTPSTTYKSGESHSNPTSGGKAFARFLRALGAQTQEDPGPGPQYDGASC